MKLIDAMPRFAMQLRAGLQARDMTAHLARQIDELDIVARCSCGAPDCAMFDTALKPSPGWPDYQTHMVPDVNADDTTIAILGVADGKIVIVDAFYDSDVSAALDRIQGLPTQD